MEKIDRLILKYLEENKPDLKDDTYVKELLRTFCEWLNDMPMTEYDKV